MADQQSGQSGSVKALLESTLESVDQAENMVLQAATDAGFGEDDLHKIGMAVREAMVNAVVHGNRYNLRKKVHLALNTTGDTLQIEIADEGDGFEAHDLPDPLAEENLLRQSGRGLLLIRAFVDEFQMKRAAPPLGTAVKLIVHKNRQQS